MNDEKKEREHTAAAEAVASASASAAQLESKYSSARNLNLASTNMDSFTGVGE